MDNPNAVTTSPSGSTPAEAKAFLDAHPEIEAFDIVLTDANGNHFRYMLLDLGAGWCVPCNNEGDQYGLNGADSAKIAQWLSKGGLYVQVLVQDHGSGGIPTQADVTQWLSDHATQSPLAADIAGSIQHIVPQSAFPANLVINLDTMQILDAWYGVDDNKISSSWEARLNQ